MKYIFIDTNILVTSAIPKHKGQVIESFDALKDIVRQEKAAILMPEIVEVEYKRVSESSNLLTKDALKNIKKFVSENSLLRKKRDV